MKKVGVFSYDAGSSELLLELVLANESLVSFQIFCIQNSPFYKMLVKSGLEKIVKIVRPEKKHINQELQLFQPDLMLYGTSWQNHHEYHIRFYCKQYNIACIAFLDNWTSYKERFGYPSMGWEAHLPDFIAVHDEESCKIANKLFDIKILSVKNYALIKQLKAFKDIPNKENNILLFLSEPTSTVASKRYDNPLYWGFDESVVYKNILEHCKYFTCKEVVVRLHPSDTKKVYQNVKSDTIFSSLTLLEDIARAKMIVGIDTVALRLGYLLGKKVLAYIPSKNREFCVPLPLSNQVRDLKNTSIEKLKIFQESVTDFGMSFASMLEKVEKQA